MNPFKTAFLLKEISQNARLVWRLLTDPRVPLRPKLVVPLTLLYIFFPIDVIPDLVPGLGQLDDLAVLLVGVKLFIDMSPHHLVKEHFDAIRYGHRANKKEQSGGTSAAPPIEGVYRVQD